jgi:deoxyadenosine/deoxycytidine kinase
LTLENSGDRTEIGGVHSKGGKMSEDARTLTLLEGNIGTGKSTVGKKLKESGLFGFIEEPVNAWQTEFPENLLDLFYKNMKRWAFTFQLVTFSTRAKTWQEVLAQTQQNDVVLERSIYCDRYVFAKNCYESGHMTKTEWQLYCKLWDWLEKNFCVSPNRIIYYRTPAEDCLKRLQERGRGEEVNIPLSYLLDLERLHDKWLIGNPLVIMLDGIREWTAQEIQQVLRDFDRGKTNLKGCTLFK